MDISSASTSDNGAALLNLYVQTVLYFKILVCVRSNTDAVKSDVRYI